MVRPWWKRLLLGTIAVPLLVLGCDRVQMIHWVGRTNLEVEFVVADSGTEAPIAGARVEIQQALGEFYEGGDVMEFVLISGGDGRARRECRNSRCFGSQSGLGLTDTFRVHLPCWRFRVLAEGYEQRDWAELHGLELHRQVQRTGPGKAKLVVPVLLRNRCQAKPGE